MGGCCSKKKKKVTAEELEKNFSFSGLSEQEEIENIRVAVRVRNFNSREIGDGSRMIMDMSDKNCILKAHQSYPERPFIFDYCYWSFDGFDVRDDGYYAPKPGSKYADQKKLYRDIGVRIIDQGFRGYHTTLFVYGQTGSGKTYTMFGDGNNKGLVPMICEAICDRAQKAPQESNIEVKYSMIQIYNEKLQDLMNDFGPILKIREAASGFFIPKLTEIELTSENLYELIGQGMTKRVTALTKMNETSSRSHVIITVKLTQMERNHKKISMINLVDLAGSEWNKKTESTGQRFEEAKAINKSLMQLSTCLFNLSEGIEFVPYRDSSLTKLLKHALQNNGKTFMIATVSPSDSNYLETLSTLRYAERAKGIQVKAKINYEDPKDTIIKELQKENERLKAELRRYQQYIPGEVLEKYLI